jgi:UDPglucose 6-dehydrogenase
MWGLSNAILLAQHNEVVALDLLAEKVAMVNAGRSPIEDADCTEYLARGGLHLTATTDPQAAFAGADYVVIATPTDYDPRSNAFDTRSIEAVAETVQRIAPTAVMVIKSTVPVGYTRRLAAERGWGNLIFSPEFLREGKALYDNLHPSRIVVGERSERARVFAELLREGRCARTCPSSSPIPTRPRRSSFSPTPISRCAWPISTSSTATR